MASAPVTAVNITNLYLYGSFAKPADLRNEELIRDQDTTTPATVDTSEYMGPGGPGRFAVGPKFELISRFFDPFTTLAPGVYSKSDLAGQFGLTSIFITIQQSLVADGIDDYLDRSYIWNSTGFKIVDNADFVVTQDGRRYIENYAVVPLGGENFDFVGSGLSNFVNPTLEYLVDPSGIGRTINIAFNGNVVTRSYSFENYQADLEYVNTWQLGAVGRLVTEGPAFIDSLWERGSTNTVIGNKPVRYGSLQNDLLSASRFIGHNKFGPLAENGVIFVAGAGDDTVMGQDGDDEIHGGDGDDQLEGHGGEDSIRGGNGNDSISGGEGADSLWGGVGNDRFEVQNGDLIYDIDQSDKVFFGADRLKGGTRTLPPGSIQDESGSYDGGSYTYSYSKESKTLTVTKKGGAESVALLDFENGEAGIRLETLPDPEKYKAPSSPTSPGGPPRGIPEVGGGRGGRKDSRGGPPSFSPAKVDPLVVDLGTDGIRLTSVHEREVFFDSAGDGIAERTGWVGPEDGLLARDLDGDGLITSNAELFGDVQAEGFAELRKLDSNGDGLMNQGDAAWSQLRVWIDANSNAITDPGELRTLASVGIASINLSSTAVDYDIAGNSVVQTGSYLTTDGVSRRVISVLFSVAQEITRQPDPADIPEDVQRLPNLDPLGGLSSLWAAMARDAALKGQVEALVEDASDLDSNAFRERLEDILWHWAGVTDVASNAYGPGVDGRHMAFVQKVRNSELLDFTREIGQTRFVENGYVALQVERMYRDAVDYFALRFGIQLADAQSALSDDQATPAESIFSPLSLLTYDRETGQVDGYIPDIAQAIAERMPQDYPQAIAYLDKLLPLLQSTADTFKEGGDLNLSGNQLARLVERGFEEAGFWGSPLAAIASSLARPDGVRWFGGAGAELYTPPDTQIVRSALIVGGGGDDSLAGGLLGDTFIFQRGDGHDTVRGFLHGYSQTFDNISDKLVIGGYPADEVRFVRFLDDVRVDLGTAGVDSVLLEGQLTGSGVHQIIAADGVSWTAQQLATLIVNNEQSAGNDAIRGTGYIDSYLPGTGDDVVDNTPSNLDGGVDSYAYRSGDGNDTIILSSGAPLRLTLADWSAADVRLAYRDQTEAVISFSGSNATIAVQTYRLAGLASITFGSGEVWSSAQLSQIAIDSSLTDADDSLFGGYGPEIFRVSLGDDTVYAGDGGDTIEFAFGTGQDVVDFEGFSFETANVVIQNALPGDVYFEVIRGVTTELRMHRGDLADGSLTFRNYTARLTSATGLTLTYADGTVQSFGEAVFNALQNAASDAPDIIVGTPDGDRIRGLGGPDSLIGGEGDDWIDGGSGNDTIDAGNGNDTIRGGAGDDVIRPRDSWWAPNADTIIFGRGDGNDTIEAAIGATLSLSGFTRDELIFDRYGLNGFKLSSSLAGAGSVTVTEAFASSENLDGIARIVGDTGFTITLAEIASEALARAATTGNDTLRAIEFWDCTLAGGLGNDRLIGGSGRTTYRYAAGDGHDVIEENGADERDTLSLAGVAASEVTVGRDGNDAVLSFANLAGSVRIVGQFARQIELTPWATIEEIQFQDGSSWSAAELALRAVQGRTAISGTTGADTLVGTTASELLSGGAGNDVLRGQAGSDRYIFGAGSGIDIIEEQGESSNRDADELFIDALPSDVRLTRLDTDVLVELPATGDAVTIRGQFDPSDDNGRLSSFQSPETGIEFITFADGTRWGVPEIANHAWIRAVSDAEYVSGSAFAEVFKAAGSTNYSFDVSGTDILEYVAGSGFAQANIGRGPNDQYTSLQINLHGIATSDVVFSLFDTYASGGGIAGSATGLFGDINIGFISRPGSILLKFYFDVRNPATYPDDRLVFDNGTVLRLVDLIPDMAVQGTRFADTFTAVPIGSGRVIPGGGDDLVLNARDGTIIEWAPGDGSDTIDGARGAVTVRLIGVEQQSAVLTQSGPDLLVQLGQETITIRGQFGTQLPSFGDDSIYTPAGADLLFADGTIARSQLAAAFVFTDPADATSVTYRGQAFGEAYQTSTSDSWITTAGGDDNIQAVGTSNLIESGEGNDTIHAEGSWTRIYAAAGDDIITFTGGGQVYGGAGNDHISTGPEDDQIWGEDGNDTILSGDGADVVLAGAGDDVVTAGIGYGGYLSGEDGNDHISFAGGFYYVEGGGGNDTLVGASGDDVLNGGSGDDSYEGGAGSDTLIDNEGGSDTYYWHVGDGSDTIIDSASAAQGYDRLVLSGLLKTDVVFSAEGTNLLIDLPSGETIRIVSQLSSLFSPGTPSQGIEEVVFEDGRVDARLIGGSGLLASQDALFTDASGEFTFAASVLIANDFVAPFRNASLVRVAEVTGSGGNASILPGGLVHLQLSDPLAEATFTYLLTDGLASARGTLVINEGYSATNAGDDTLPAIDGVLYGGAGSDTVDFSALPFGVTVDLGTVRFQEIYGLGRLRLVSVENAVGTSFGDAIFGGLNANHVAGMDGDDLLWGLSGNDQLDGGDGSDTLDGGAGADTLTGGGGFDMFIVSMPTEVDGADHITDFGTGIDRLMLSAEAFGLTGAWGDPVDPGVFRVGVNALTAAQRFIYNPNTGSLSFDPDGSGEEEPIEIAKFAPWSVIGASDFVLGW